VKVLVTGTDGYLGCPLVPRLTRAGHEVIGLDTGYYRDGWLFNGVAVTPHTRIADLRSATAEDFVGIDAVVHMAELSNDPLGELLPGITHEINHRGSLHLAELAKAAGVRRFIYMSSCSVYGVAADEVVDETSPVNPQTAYAECKTLVERDLSPLADDGFSPTFLRNATAFGASPRQRFDLVLNNLAGLAWTTGRIAMTSDGTPWRPLAHVEDIGKAIECALAAPRDVVHDQIFNVGADDQNYQIRYIAEIVADVFPGCELSFGELGGDNRSYRVSFEKIHRDLPGFACEWDAERGARQLRGVFERIGLTEALFLATPFTRLRALEHLMATGQLDANLYWNVVGADAPDVPVSS
jgi:nucleoside-diphosphate-sugar epimerase